MPNSTPSRFLQPYLDGRWKSKQVVKGSNAYGGIECRTEIMATPLTERGLHRATEIIGPAIRYTNVAKN